jgi:hypothetical protein
MRAVVDVVDSIRQAGFLEADAPQTQTRWQRGQ